MATIAVAASASAEMLDNSQLSLVPAEQTAQIETMIEIVFDPLEERVPGIVDMMTLIADVNLMVVMMA